MLENRLSPLDATFLLLENDDSNMCVGGADVFAGPAPSYDELLEELDRRMDAVPNFRHRRVDVPLGLGRSRWADAEDFRIEDHIRHTALPAPGSAEQLQSVFSRIMSNPINHEHPPWEMWLVEGLEGGRFALLHKMHHALVDGIASVQVLEQLFSASPDGDETIEARETKRRPAPSKLRMTIEALVERTLVPEAVGLVTGAVTDPKGTAESAVRTAAGLVGLGRAAVKQAPSTPYNHPVGPARSFSWQRESMTDVKALKDALGGSVNDVVLTVMAAALGSDLRGRGMETDGLEIYAFIPVSVRSDDGKGELGNKVSGLKVALPMGVGDPLERFARVHEAMGELKSSPQALGASTAVDSTGLVPAALFEAVAGIGDIQRYVNTVITNVPGPRKKLYFLGRELEDVVGFVPLAANLAMNTAVVSYTDKIGFGFCADPSIVADVDRMAPALHAAFEELAGAAGVTLGGTAEMKPAAKKETTAKKKPAARKKPAAKRKAAPKKKTAAAAKKKKPAATAKKKPAATATKKPAAKNKAS